MDSITDLDYSVLNAMMDDYEDVEQLYLMLRDRFALRDVIDTVNALLQDGLIEAKYTNDEEIAPLAPINEAMIHHYWFGPTTKGQAEWQAFAGRRSK